MSVPGPRRRSARGTLARHHLRASAALVLVSLAASSVAAGVAVSGWPASAPAMATSSTSTTSTAPPVPAALPPGTAPWTVVSSDYAGVAVETQSVTAPSGRPVTLLRFDAGHVVFDIHVGSTDPPADLATIRADRGPALAADELGTLVAAFNGGFKMNAHQGGVEVDGQVVAPLVPGEASLVIDADGAAHIGVWGQDLPTPGEQVESVRQNQPPLIEHGVIAPTASVPADWGLTIGGAEAVPRSAAGEDARGDIIYAAGMDLVPADLASVLQGAGALEAMQLDINPEWVQAVTAAAPGTPLSTAIPGQNRPAGQYVAGWSRDFFAVLALTKVDPKRPR